MTLFLEGGGLQVSPLMGRTPKTEARGSQWPRKELIKYGVFLRYFKEGCSLASTFEQDKWTFFRGLSLFVQSKNPNQCRIFHNKLMREFLTMEGVLESLTRKIERFQHWCDIYESSLINIRNILARQYESSNSTSLFPYNSNKSSSGYGTEKGIWGSEIKVKQEERPTDADYPDERGEVNLPLAYRPVNITVKATGYPTYEERRNNLPDLRFDETITQPWNYTYHSQTMMEQLPENQNQQLWLDCHNTFLAYRSKLSSLLSRSNFGY